MAVFGLVIAKYFILAHLVISAPSGAELGLSYFSPELFNLFLQNIGSSLSPFDLLWIAFALMAAWRIPAPSRIEVGP
jgi:RsiW-degrading membrane proteinase PrsW (M82 family)